jgi:predicted anti-sigma-YlaC factor YlaD
VYLVVENGTCIRARQRLSLALDGEADASEVLAASSHIAGCKECREFAKRVGVLTIELRSVRTSSPDHRQTTAERGERS